MPLVDPTTNLPWNSDWSATENYTSVAQMAAHPYFAALFSNAIPGRPTSFTTFALVTYAWAAEPDWCHGVITPADAAEITRLRDEVARLLEALVAVLDAHDADIRHVLRNLNVNPAT